MTSVAGRAASFIPRLEVQPFERRRHSRHNAIGLVVRIDGLGVVGLARVANLSDNGAMISLSAPLTVGSPVKLSFDCTNSLQARVVWNSPGRIGIRFLRPIDCGQFIGKVASDRWSGPIRPPRLPANGPARVETSAGSFATVVNDISEKGMKICPGGNLPVGTSVEIVLEQGMRVRGTVRWSDGIFAGIQLSGKIGIDDLANSRMF